MHFAKWIWGKLKKNIARMRVLIPYLVQFLRKLACYLRKLAEFAGLEWIPRDRVKSCIVSCKRKLQHNFLPIFCIAVSQAGLIASGVNTGDIKVWKAENPQDPYHYKTLKENTVELSKLYTDDELLMGKPTSIVTSLAFSQDGTKLVSGSSCDNKVRVWDVDAGECMMAGGHAHCVLSVAISPDNKTVVSGIPYKNEGTPTIHVWGLNMGSLTLKHTLKGHTNDVTSVTFSQDGALLASVSGKTIKLWDTRTWECVAVLTDHRDEVFCVAFSPDGRVLASGSHDKTIKLWDIESSEYLATLERVTTVLSLTFSTDGSTLYYGLENMTSMPFRIPHLAD
ncbi:WD domain, G-beta repeat [Carpediemonas membranifera]|uniref:WD domain, G-beta repeat n=1 Tax=Carpediemonas membranifera TaxID=201153 RepID=A0A8J6BVM8_9EUKA|nr:WD domain, G-beta repeat [Carpediemonas membranifera]|eukprot:KAG9391566.1 WD domain, G-beta repeat [Carpediemonas membranifera]